MTGSSSSADAVFVRLTIPDLSFSQRLEFPDTPTFELAERLLFGRASGARLPQMTYELCTYEGEPSLRIACTPLDDVHARVRFGGVIDSPEYVAELAGFHWDFSKLLNALVMTRTLSSGLAPLHAAAIEGDGGVVLLPGASGAGKSSVSYSALAQRIPVYCSELGFFSKTTLMAANSAITIDSETIQLFDLPPVDQPAGRTGRLQFDLAPRHPVQISSLAFLQVSDGSFRARPITQRRARMLLFENMVTQLPVTQLLSQETWPLWIPPARHDVEAAMSTLHALSELEPVILEGPPPSIVEALTNSSSWR